MSRHAAKKINPNSRVYNRVINLTGYGDVHQWLGKVQRLIATRSRNRERFPHKVFSVANVLAHIGNECRLNYEGIAERAGCVTRTVLACIKGLEEHGLLTRSHTAKPD